MARPCIYLRRLLCSTFVAHGNADAQARGDVGPHRPVFVFGGPQNTSTPQSLATNEIQSGLHPHTHRHAPPRPSTLQALQASSSPALVSLGHENQCRQGAIVRPRRPWTLNGPISPAQLIPIRLF